MGSQSHVGLEDSPVRLVLAPGEGDARVRLVEGGQESLGEVVGEGEQVLQVPVRGQAGEPGGRQLLEISQTDRMEIV